MFRANIEIKQGYHKPAEATIDQLKTYKTKDT